MMATYPWGAFPRLQRLVDNPINDCRSRGDDEAFTALIERWAMGTPAINEDTAMQDFETLRANRKQKHRQRLGLLKKAAEARNGSAANGADDEVLAYRQLAMMAEACVPPDDWRLLRDLADGDAYAQLAARYGVSIGTVKARVSRARQLIRRSRVGAWIKRVIYGAVWRR